MTASMRVAGLFAGIGGLELGLARAGHEAQLLCEIDPAASTVLAHQFPTVQLAHDVREIGSLPSVDLVAAGFPCQDISLAGTRDGLQGRNSGLVAEVFRLVAENQPEFVLLENVLNLLRLQRGAVMHVLMDRLERLGYNWAYRVVDTRGFGLPQRRQRVFILASLGDVQPQDVLFRDAVDPAIRDAIGPMRDGHMYGFYWTEGKRGVGWAEDAVPTIKGGSGLGIPSPPAVFDTETRTAGTPSIEDAERLQGFPASWTHVEIGGKPAKAGARWRMIGNAVSVPAAEWIGRALQEAIAGARWEMPAGVRALAEGQSLPPAAMGRAGIRLRVPMSAHVETAQHAPLRGFLNDPLKPLSGRALRGYIHRATTGTKRFPEGFLPALTRQAEAA